MYSSMYALSFSERQKEHEMWFEVLTGFSEISPDQVRENISVDGEILKSHENGRQFVCGSLETPSLGDLRDRVRNYDVAVGNISVREVIADVQHLHVDKVNAGSLFQVASQFNLLEMVSPNISPEQGVGKYEYDLTQGPACAIAAGAGTIYRNYFAPINGKLGQSADNQIDCLSDLGVGLGNYDNRLWEMTNGYALASEKGLIEITNKIKSSSEAEIDDLRKLLRIGVQWNTEVTLGDSRHTVSQVYCSALPVAYSQHSSDLWSEFAQLVLEATYEATVCSGILNAVNNGNKTLFLTLIGGGAFGNKIEWIINALQRSLEIYKHVDLDVAIVSYRHSDYHTQELIRRF